MVHFIGTVFVMVVTAVMGYLILGAMHPDVSPILPVVFYTFIGFMSGRLFMGVYGMAVDATLQCFIATEELVKDLDDLDFVPAGMKAMIDKEAGKDDSEGDCGGRCPLFTG